MHLHHRDLVSAYFRYWQGDTSEEALQSVAQVEDCPFCWEQVLRVRQVMLDMLSDGGKWIAL
jgi:hypothetical protein